MEIILEEYKELKKNWFGLNFFTSIISNFKLDSNFFYYFKIKNNYFLNKTFRVLKVLKNVFMCNFSYFVDANCIDKIGEKNFIDTSLERFDVCYITQNKSEKFRSCFVINSNEFKFYSMFKLFFAANWVERELSELFGVDFFKHNDLRGLLLDYGFKGYPLRKDFPLTGFLEINYDSELSSVVYGKVLFQQEFRKFDLVNSWRS